MAFTVYSDFTGTGTGDFVAMVKTIEQAREIGQTLLSEDTGYSIFDDIDETAPAVEFKPRPSVVARKEGASAYVAIMNFSRDREPCPYPPGSACRAAWIEGWQEAVDRRRERESWVLGELLGEE